jgi:hypothetical protein
MKRHIDIVTPVLFALILAACMMFVSCGLFRPSKDMIIKAVKDNQALLNKVPAEIKGLDDYAMYISIVRKEPINEHPPSSQATKIGKGIEDLYLLTIRNGVFIYSGLQNDVLSEALEITGVRGIKEGESDTRFFVFFDCNGPFDNMVCSCGFYYSEDNRPVGWKGSDYGDELTPDGNGWKTESEIDNYYTEKIADNWFYFYYDLKE